MTMDMVPLVETKESGGFFLMFRRTHETEMERLQKEHEEHIKKLLDQFKEASELLMDGYEEVNKRHLPLIIELARLSGVGLVEEHLPSGFVALVKNAGDDIVNSLHRKRSHE